VTSGFKCVLHGSFQKHFDELKQAREIFEAAGIEVLAPKRSEIVSFESGFARLEGEAAADPRLVELQYLQHLRTLGSRGFSYFVNPDGYIGRSASYELGIAQATNVPVFCLRRLKDLPAYLHHNSVWRPGQLTEYIAEHGALPDPQVRPNENLIHRLWEKLLIPSSVVAAGAIIEHAGKRRGEPEILLVKTHKWGGRYSLVGERVRWNERLKEALVRGVKEETGLTAVPRRHLCTFDQIKDSGYYRPGVSHVFVDYAVTVESKRVTLDDEAEDFAWMPAREALDGLPLEPNARKTVEHYLEPVKTP
jgi:ADP-ribose pyrophosphatase YjhB (NUDIX family)